MKLYYLMFMLLLISFVSSEIEYIEQNVPSNLQFTCTIDYAIPSASATYNLSIFYPDGTTLVNNKQAQALGQGAFNYTVTFPEIGRYRVLSFCYDGSNGNYSSQDFYEVTGNGKENPDGVVTSLFSVFYLIVFGCLVYVIVYSFGHFLKLDFDLIDLAYSFGIFFVFLTLFYLSKFYVGNVAIENIMELFIWPAGILLLLVPLVMFVVSITVGALKPQEMTYGTRRLRRSKL